MKIGAIQVSTTPRGYRTMYAPRTPAIAPLAPMFGIAGSPGAPHWSVTSVCSAPRPHPGPEVEDDVAEAAERVLDVVPEDPEEQHVPEQVDIQLPCMNIEMNAITSQPSPRLGQEPSTSHGR